MRTIYINGLIYTGSLPLQEAFVEENGMCLFVGSNEEANMFYRDADQIVNLDGHFVCSGFIDSHMHLLGYGNLLQSARLAEHTTSLAELISYFKEFADSHSTNDNTWIMGRGWNQDYFTDEKRIPNRYDLDCVSTTQPVCAVRCCGHCLSVNSKALSLLGITSKTLQPEGGHIGMLDGQPDGTFFDNAMQLVYDRFPLPSKENIKQMIRSACKALNAYGITSCQSDDYCSFRQLPYTVINEAFQELEESGELTVRVYEQSNFTTLSDLKAFINAGNCTGCGTDFFQIGPLKMLGDGSLGARTAFMSKPYADDPTTKGLPVFTQETLDEMISYANEHDMQCAVHAIGDGCLDRVLSAYEKALTKNQKKDHRHGIVHCQISRPDQLDKIAALGLHVYCQSIFLDYDINIVIPRVGVELASTSYSWKTLMEKGVIVSNGSDCPVELPDPLASMQCAITRSTLQAHIGPYLKEQAFTVQEALDSYTKAGAYASFEENKKGQLHTGFFADFVILEKNPFELNPLELKDIKILATYINGRKVF